MPKIALEDFLEGLSLEEIKKTILSLIDQFFPIMEDSERQEFVIKLLGRSGDDKLSSMVNR